MASESPKTEWLPIFDLRGGRNGSDPPFSLTDTECAEAINVDWQNTTFARRRGGAAAMTTANASFHGLARTVPSMTRHVPSSDDLAAELWAIDSNKTINRFSRGFMAGLANTFASANGSAVWTPNGSLAPNTVLTVGQRVKVDGNTYTVLTVNSTAFTATPNTPTAYTANTVQPEGLIWTQPTVSLAMTGDPIQTDWASLDTKLFIANKFTQDAAANYRLMLWDTSTVRPAGLRAASSAPNTANQGAGTYAAIERHYRIRWTTQVSSVTTRRSEPSPVVTFTPSGSGASARITRPTAVSEGETHWEVEASLNGANYFVIATVALATTTYDDSEATTEYSDNDVSPAIGSYTIPKAYKFVASDQNRVLGFGSHDPSQPQNRVEFSAVVGSLNISDAERVPVSNYISLDENDSGPPTGLVGPVDGSFFAFKMNQVWKLTPTGQPDTPYQARAISKTVGAYPRTIVIADDELGNPAIYWLSLHGPYRYGMNGLEYIGNGIEDRTNGAVSRIVNFDPFVAADDTLFSHHTVFYSDAAQVWYYVWTILADETEEYTKFVWSIGRPGGTSPSDHPVPSGWAVHTGPSVQSESSVMFSDDITGVHTSRTLKPYVGNASGTARIWKCDVDDVNDAGTNFSAYVISKVYMPWGMMKNGTISRSYMLAGTANNVSITQSIIADYGVETSNSTVSLTATGTEARVRRRFEDAGLADIGAVQFRWGDAGDNALGWQLDAVIVEARAGEVA